MTEAGNTLAEDWKAQVRVLGKRGFENAEMLRLGFVSEETLSRLAKSGVSEAQYKEAVAGLASARDELARLNREISALQDVETAIAEIRARRIERVKAAAVVRRAEKEIARIERTTALREQRRVAPTFLGRGVSDRLRFVGGDEAALAARNLPALNNFADVADALGLPPEQLQWLVYERGAGRTDHYTRFEIPKRTGGTRLISSPKPALRSAQAWVRTRILVGQPVHPAATAFRPGTSIVDNAMRHAGSAVVVRMDLKDFFPSITYPRVRAHFESLGYNPGIASVLALLCTDAPRVRVTHGQTTHIVAVGERGLPQGACTSPDLANLIANRLDRRITGLTARVGWTFTRYADDLVFSTSIEDAQPHRLVRAVNAIAVAEGFTVNSAKTRIMRSPNRQAVTGLIVNDNVRMSRRDLRRIRAFLHRCESRGLEEVTMEMGKDARAMARGYYAYVHMVTPDVAARLRQRHPWI